MVNSEEIVERTFYISLLSTMLEMGLTLNPEDFLPLSQENRIAVARNRYISTVQDFNSYARQFPQVMTAKVIGMDTKPNFSAEQSAQTAPKVSFE